MNTPKVITLVILLLFLTFNISAQITINGTITDSDSNPISNALVEIIDQDDTNNYYSSTTNAVGNFNIANIFTDIGAAPSSLPSDFIVLRNYPNPFNPSTIIYYELPKSENIELKIYDILGREVRTLFNGFHKTGNYTIFWDGRNDWNSPVAAGVYLCRLKTKDNFKVHKMVLLDGGSNTAFISSTIIAKQNKKEPNITNTIFNYSVRISGEDILLTEIDYLSCSGDTTLNLKVPKILKSVTIGPEGGKLETEDFSLTVPEGAFLESETLSLGIEPDTTSAGYKLVSKYFRLDGLPDKYYKDLKFIIKLEKLINDSIYAGFGIPDTIKFLDESIINFDFYTALDSSDHAIVNLTSPYSGNGGLLKKIKINKIENGSNIRRTIIALMSPGKVYSANNNFIIYYPKSKALVVPIIDNYLENAVEIIKGLGFSKSSTRTNIFPSIWPIVVNFRTSGNNKGERSKALLSSESHGFYEELNNKYYLKKLWKIFINGDIYESDDFHTNLRRVIGRSVFAQFINQIYLKIDWPQNKWLLKSIPIWSEKLFPQNDSHIPSLYDWNDETLNKFKAFAKWDFSLEILNGIPYKDNPKIKISIIHHVIAFSSLIEYLSKNMEKKEMGLIDLHNNIISNGSSVEGLIAVMEETENIWWPNFFKEFIQGNIYNVPSEEFLKNITETIEFNDGDTIKYVDEMYSDLSAKLFKINVRSDEIKDRSLNFKLGPESLNLDYVKALVFGISGNNLTFISEGINFSVGNLSQFDGLLACVVNSGNEPPYTGTSNIDLDIKVKDELQFNACKIEVRVRGIWERHRIPPPPDTSPTIDTMDYRAEWYTIGNFNDNVFVGVLDESESGSHVSGDVELVLDDQLNIASFSIDANSNYEQEKMEWGCVGTNVTLNTNSEWNMYFEVNGENTINNLTKLYHYHESPPSPEGVIPYSKLIDYFSDENSCIKVTLYKKSIP